MFPVAKHHFQLSPVVFGDALALHYHQPQQRMNVTCNGCWEPMSIEHALDYKRGRVLIQRFKKVRDALADIAAKSYGSVLRHAIVREADLDGKFLALIVDLGVCGVWQPQSDVLFDVHVIRTDTQSCCYQTVQAGCSCRDRGFRYDFRFSGSLRN